MKKLFLIFMLSFSFSANAEEVKLPLEIEVNELTPKKGHVKVLSFFYDGKTCRVQTSSKNKRTETLSRCKKIVDALAAELKQKEVPSDLINPKGSYWDVKLKSSTGNWQQTVQKEKMQLCDSTGKCTDSKTVPARTIAKTLVQEFVK